MARYQVPCWNCDEGFVEPCDEWGADRCSICAGKGFLIVTELTDDNCEEAIRIDEPFAAPDQRQPETKP